MSVSDLVERLSTKLREANMKMATAESCTGGMIAAAMTDLAGSSDIFERGFVTYSNDAKTELLDVLPDILQEHGAVSSQTAKAMVQGALNHSHADIAVSVTGIAGPGGGTDEKPVGLVYIGYGIKDKIQSAEHHFDGNRTAIRQQTVEAALTHLLNYLDQTK